MTRGLLLSIYYLLNASQYLILDLVSPLWSTWEQTHRGPWWCPAEQGRCQHWGPCSWDWTSGRGRPLWWWTLCRRPACWEVKDESEVICPVYVYVQWHPGVILSDPWGILESSWVILSHPESSWVILSHPVLYMISFDMFWYLLISGLDWTEPGPELDKIFR